MACVTSFVERGASINFDIYATIEESNIAAQFCPVFECVGIVVSILEVSILIVFFT
jgi:hypothetical protein